MGRRLYFFRIELNRAGERQSSDSNIRHPGLAIQNHFHKEVSARGKRVACEPNSHSGGERIGFKADLLENGQQESVLLKAIAATAISYQLLFYRFSSEKDSAALEYI